MASSFTTPESNFILVLVLVEGSTLKISFVSLVREEDGRQSGFRPVVCIFRAHAVSLTGRERFPSQ